MTVNNLGRILTREMIHVLVIFAMTRRHVRSGAASGTS
jgi:hypothetical protein